tara:strand:+ start:557 stop:865 length:309 start_codon:yes stop_codon:yes gene_type:complete
MESMSLLLSIVAIANMAVLSIIIIIFTKTYVKTKARLPIGIIIFSSLMFLHNIVGAYTYFDDHLNLMMHVQQIVSMTTFPYTLIIHIAELAGLLVFLRISWD